MSVIQVDVTDKSKVRTMERLGRETVSDGDDGFARQCFRVMPGGTDRVAELQNVTLTRLPKICKEDEIVDGVMGWVYCNEVLASASPRLLSFFQR